MGNLWDAWKRGASVLALLGVAVIAWGIGSKVLITVFSHLFLGSLTDDALSSFLPEIANPTIDDLAVHLWTWSALFWLPLAISHGITKCQALIEKSDGRMASDESLTTSNRAKQATLFALMFAVPLLIAFGIWADWGAARWMVAWMVVSIGSLALLHFVVGEGRAERGE